MMYEKEFKRIKRTRIILMVLLCLAILFGFYLVDKILVMYSPRDLCGETVIVTEEENESVD